MACAETQVINWKKTIKKGFPFSGLLTFRVTTGSINLADYNFLFAIKPSSSIDATKVTPTFVVDGNSVAFTFSAIVTAGMASGVWVGSVGLQRISDGSLRHSAKFRIVVEEVVTP
jgi:hypothetical protein